MTYVGTCYKCQGSSALGQLSASENESWRINTPCSLPLRWNKVYSTLLSVELSVSSSQQQLNYVPSSVGFFPLVTLLPTLLSRPGLGNSFM